jgi:MFS transporter, YNFM family, putative membrane transport protein
MSHAAGLQPRTAGSHELCALLWIAYCTFAAMYSPQPLLQSISIDLATDRAAAGLLLTVVILPLGIAPLLYGLFLNSVPLRPLLCAGMVCTCLSLRPPVFIDSYWLFLAMRFVQGLIAPAMLLSLMMYVSTHYSGTSMQRAMALYTAFTMIGSFSGRLICGYVASLYTWRGALVLLALLCASAACASLLLHSEGKTKASHIAPSKILDILRQEDVRKIILCAPLCIFVHASVLNFIPFYMHDLDNSVSEFGISIIYHGSLLCAMLGIFSRYVVPLLGGEVRTVMVGLSLFVVFIPLLLLHSALILFISLLGMSAGFALVYTTMPGMVNRASTSEKSITNGVYLSAYYIFAASGTFFPMLLYSHYGLLPYVLCLLGVIFLALYFAFGARSVQGHLQ